MIPDEEEARRERDALAATGMGADGDHLPASAERRARRAWLGDAALLRRAEAAETSVRTLESRLAELRLRQAEVEHEREQTAVQLAERELELRRVKQREYAEQQLRVEAEEVAVRARRGHRSELDRWQRRLDAAHAAARRAEAQRDALAARLAAVEQSAARLGEGVSALQKVAVELRVTFERKHEASQTRIRQLESQLERLRALPATPPRSDADEARRREEMAGALAAAVARLRSRAVVAEEPQAEQSEPSALAPHPQPEPPAPPPVAPTAGAREVSTVIVVPRLFAGRRRSGSRLAPAARRVAARLSRWADRTQQRAG